MKQFNAITSLIGACLATSTGIAGVVSVTVFASVAAFLVRIALLFLLQQQLQKHLKIFTVKQEKRDTRKLLSPMHILETKLESR